MYIVQDTGTPVPPCIPKDDRDKITFTREQLMGQKHRGSNPLLLSIRDMQYSPQRRLDGTGDR